MRLFGREPVEIVTPQGDTTTLPGISAQEIEDALQRLVVLAAARRAPGADQTGGA